MIFKDYKINIALRIFLLLANSIGLSYYLVNTDYYIVSINLIILLIIQIFLFYRYLNRVRIDLANFFHSVKSDDSTFVYNTKGQNDLFTEVYSGLNMINENISQIRIENKTRDNYSRILTEHVTLGLIVFDMDGKVELFNKAAKTLLGLDYLADIKTLDKLSPGISDILLQIEPTSQKLIKINNKREIFPVLILAAEFKMTGTKKKLISLQNIKNELDEKEMLSWQKLSRILTHEIMNSIAPISSTIKEITRMMKDTDIIQRTEDKNSAGLLNKILEGLEIIDERSNGLLAFVTTYRRINSVPEPKIARVDIKSMLDGIDKLIKEEIKRNNIILSVTIEDDLVVNGDIKQLQQIFLNLINNSIDALEGQERKEIKIRSFIQQGNRPSIEIEDNGCGIPSAIIDQIFVPFFTTREKGSGIGLSLSRQIMLLHGGSIIVQSTEGEGSVFILRF